MSAKTEEGKQAQRNTGIVGGLLGGPVGWGITRAFDYDPIVAP